MDNKSMMLILAVQENRKRKVEQLLIRNEVDVNFTDSHRKSALHYAIENNNSEIVKILLDHKADIYIKDSTNKIVADYVIEILSSDEKREIVKLITEKIVGDAIAILEDYNKSQKKPEAEEMSETEESPEDHNHAEKNVYKKIKALSKRLEDPNPSKYKAANTFLIFLDIFCYETSSDISNEIKYLRDTLLKKKCLTPEIIINVVEYCSPGFDSDQTYHELVGKKIQFFIKLAEFLKSFNGNKNLADISTFFSYENVQQINHVIYSDEIDPEEVDDGFQDHLKSWIVKTYNNERDIEWDQHWFEFNVNIYPYFIHEVNKENKDLMETEMSHLRDNFILSIEQISKKNWIQNFKEFIIKLKGKLLEYFYAKKLHKSFSLTSPNCADYNKIKENINKDFENIRDEFECDRIFITDCFASKFEKSLFPTLVSNNQLDKSLIEDYFFFIPTIEYLNENVRDRNSCHYNNFNCHRNTDDTDNTDKTDDTDDTDDEEIIGAKLLLDDRSRKSFFEQYVNAKRYKKREDKKIYRERKKSLINGLSEYGINKECVENIFEPDLADKIGSEVSLVVDKVYYFVQDIAIVNETCITAKEIDVVRFVENLFRDTTNHSKVSRAFTVNSNVIPAIVKRNIGIFKSASIAGIDVKATVVTMFKTFYNAFDEYRIVNNVGDLFKRETFLNALLHKQEGLLLREEDQLSILIEQLLKVDYMSPLIAKIIQHLKNEKSKSDRVKALINKDSMKRLIQYLAKEDCSYYLGILLEVQFEEYDPYESLLDLVEKKEIDLECIYQIFDNFLHIKGFDDALQLTRLVAKYCDDKVSEDYTERIIIPFLKLINLKVRDRLSRTRSNCRRKYIRNVKECEIKEYKMAQDSLSISNEIEKEFSDQTLTPCHKHCIDRELLNAEISNKQKSYTKCHTFLTSVTKTLKQCKKNNEHSQIHDPDRYKLLTQLIKYQNLKTDIISDSMKITKEDQFYENIVVNFKKLYNDIVSGFCQKQEGFENILCTYKEIVDDENYKKLLTTSQILCSEKYFSINNIALSLTFFIWLKYCTKLPTSSDDTELERTLNILENIYSCRKTSETVELLKHVATIYKNNYLSQYMRSNYPTNSVYCLKALARFKMYDNIRKDSFAIFARNAIEKDMLDVLYNYIFLQYKSLSYQDLNFNRLEVLTKVHDQCRQIYKCIESCSYTNNKLNRQYFQKFLELYVEICQSCGYHSKPSEDPMWIKFYRKAVKLSDRGQIIERTYDENRFKKFIDKRNKIQTVIEAFDKAELCYKQNIDEE